MDIFATPAINSLAVLGVLLYIIVRIAQRGTDERLTKENHKWAHDLDRLVYWDHTSNCYRSTKTNQPAQESVSRDIDGEPFKYVMTRPLCNTRTMGKFIEARYIDVNKWNEPIKYTEYDKKRFFEG